MMKWSPYFLSALLLNPALHADEMLAAFSSPLSTPQQTSTTTYPYKPTQEWQLTESYLLWKPFQSDIDYGTRYDVPVNDFTPVTIQRETHIRTKKPAFNWSSGFRLSLAKDLPGHDNWDIDLVGTYVYGTGSGKCHPNLLENQFFSSYFTPVNMITMSNKMNWNVNYLTLDLFMGRAFSMTDWIVFHPYIGLRGASIKQHSLGKGSFLMTGGVSVVSLKERIHINNDFWGIGPRVGTDFTFNMSRHWNLLSNLSAAFFYGQTHVQEKMTQLFSSNNPNIGLSGTLAYKVRDKERVIRANVEAALGVGWEKWVHGNTVRIAPSLVFEGSMWFNLTHIPQHRIAQKEFPANERADVTSIRRHGQLAFLGFAFNFEVDF